MAAADEWAQQQWGTVELGDKRRTARAVQVGAQMAANPGALLPGQMQGWGDLKAAYRLLNQSAVTHEALSAPHWQQTRERARQSAGPVLFIQDDSHLDYTCREADGLGQIGDPNGRGLMIHSTLAVQPGEMPAILGLAHQLVWARQGLPHKGRETRQERYYRKGREFENWYGALAAIGRPPPGSCWISVADRASDMFSYWRQAVDADWHCLLRVVHDRRIQGEDDSGEHLREWAAGLPSAAEETLHLRTRPDRVARTVTLAVAWGHTSVLPPRNDPTATGKPPVDAWVIRAWETTAPPAGEEPLEWLLLSTLPVENARQAHERLQWYRCRWLIEHYHKALKTGCRMEDSQLQQGEALKRQLGFLSIVAVRLLQVETLARTVPELPADQAADPQLLEFVCRLRHLDAAQMTIYQFWREVAKFGGFLGRKHDGEPGWQTLWRGWNYLYPRFEGYLLGKSCG